LFRSRPREISDITFTHSIFLEADQQIVLTNSVESDNLIKALVLVDVRTIFTGAL